MVPSTHGRTALLLLLLVAAARTSSAVEYTITDLGALSTLPNRPSYACDINDAGQVIGTARLDDGTLSLFLWDPQNGIQDLGIPAVSGWDSYRFNNVGQIVGIAPGIGGFVWSSATGVRGLFSPDGEGATAYGVNDLGVVVGQGVLSTMHEFPACLWDAEANPQFLGIPDVWQSAGLDVNNAGQVVGWSGGDFEGTTGRAFLWDETNGVQYLGTLGRAFSSGLAINNLGQVVGWVGGGLDDPRGFIWDSEDGMRPLESLEEAFEIAYDINDSGQVVGALTIVGHPALWDRGVITNLELEVGHPAGWFLGDARAINASGQIVGRGANPNGEVRAFLLTPIPEPGAVALLLSGLLALAGLSRRHRGMR